VTAGGGGYPVPHTGTAGPPCGAASYGVLLGGAPTYDVPPYGLPPYGPPTCGEPVGGAPAYGALAGDEAGSGARRDGGANGFVGCSGVVMAARASASWCPILA
jgi:hypothetical protein